MAYPRAPRIDLGNPSRSRALMRPVEGNERPRGPYIVALGGGTGLPAVLEGLSEVGAEKGETDPAAVTGIVTVTDDGGSSGQLRRQLGILPPGDARNCLLALA